MPLSDEAPPPAAPDMLLIESIPWLDMLLIELLAPPAAPAPAPPALSLIDFLAELAPSLAELLPFFASLLLPPAAPPPPPPPPPLLLPLSVGADLSLRGQWTSARITYLPELIEPDSPPCIELMLML